ncbi:SDR family NAD(P)-dependent oxidoreductase [Streptomyces bobili]|uniref:SDR family NAD(P)-dependent oxidoreductase n=1 Tax=Streptomyces bobili TaxID=67280 RepID=UPI0036FB617A
MNDTERSSASPGRRSVLAGAVAGLAMAAAPTAAAAASTSAAAPGPGRATSAGARRYQGKVVLVTGATSGIGRAAAIAFAREGAKVGFCGRREDLGRQVERQIRAAGGEATYIRADVRSPEQVESFVDTVARRYGRLDVALNNAGVQYNKPLVNTTIEEWDDTAHTNTRAVFLAIKYEIPHLIAAKGGVILVTGSSNEFATRPGLGAYAASKGGVSGLVRTAAVEHGKDNIRVVALSPGTTNTPMLDAHRPGGLTDAQWEAEKAKFGEANVDGLKRMARPEEMASAALALASSDLSFLTGTSVLVDGGALAGL